jgi:hypothetical protein
MVSKHGNDVLAVNVDEADVVLAWLKSFGGDIVLNVAGPRESEAPGIYEKACMLLTEVITRVQNGE